MKIWIVLFACAVSLPAEIVSKLEVPGNAQKKSEAILAAAGLKRGATISKTDLDNACDHLMQTGLFASCRYTYKVISSGWDVVLNIAELPASQAVHLNVKGVDEERIWSWLKSSEPLLERTAPNSDAANAYYTRAVQEFLKSEKIAGLPAPRVLVDLGSHETTVAVGTDLPISRSAERSRASGEKEVKLMLGKLTVNGLPDFTTKRVYALWKIQEGAPVSQADVDDFAARVFKEAPIGIEIGGVDPQVIVRPGTNVADVIMTFKRP